MKNTKMLKKKIEFKILFTRGKITYGRNLTLYVMPNKSAGNKLGIAIGKKSGKAVERNRIKRLIRENYKLTEPQLGCGYNILISVNKKCEIKKADFYSIQKEMQKIFKKSGIWAEKNEESSIESN